MELFCQSKGNEVYAQEMQHGGSVNVHFVSSIVVESVLGQSRRPQIVCAFPQNLRECPERSAGVQTMHFGAMTQFRETTKSISAKGRYC